LLKPWRQAFIDEKEEIRSITTIMDLASSLGNFYGMVANYFPFKEIRSQTILT